MSLITGIYARQGHAIKPDWHVAMRSAYADFPSDRCGAVQLGLAHLGCEQRFSVPEAPFAGPIVTKRQLSMVFDGRIDNRRELAQSLGILVGSQTPDEELVLASYVQWGQDAPKHLIGDFAFAIFDAQAGKLMLARDHLGARPLYTANTDQYVAFASSALPLLELPWVNKNANLQWVADYLTITKADRASTYFQGISKFPPRSTLCLPGDQTPRPYWDLKVASKPLQLDDQAAVAQFTLLFDQAVQCRTRCYGDLSSELSGGLDSTSISVTAARQMQIDGKTLDCYSHVLPMDDFASNLPIIDERREMSAVLAVAPPITHHLLTGEADDFLPLIDASLSIHGGPTGHDLNQMAQDLLDCLSAQDRRVLLSGFGGDQLVTSKLALRLTDIGHGLSAREWIAFSRKTPKSFLKAVVKLGLWYLGRYRTSDCKNEIAKEQASARYWSLNEDFCAAHGYPLRYLQNPTQSNALGRANRQRETILSPAVQFRIEESAIGAAAHGVDYRYPMLDIRLLEFCINLPTKYTIGPSGRRLMIRKAMKGRLADSVRLRDDKNGSTIGSVYMNFVKTIDDIVGYFSENTPTGVAAQSLNTAVLAERTCDISDSSWSGETFKVSAVLRALTLARWSEIHHEK